MIPSFGIRTTDFHISATPTLSDKIVIFEEGSLSCFVCPQFSPGASAGSDKRPGHQGGQGVTNRGWWWLCSCLVTSLGCGFVPGMVTALGQDISLKEELGALCHLSLLLFSIPCHLPCPVTGVALAHLVVQQENKPGEGKGCEENASRARGAAAPGLCFPLPTLEELAGTKGWQGPREGMCPSPWSSESCWEGLQEPALGGEDVLDPTNLWVLSFLCFFLSRRTLLVT